MSTATTGVVQRIVRHPIKTVTPVIMRRLGIQRPIQVTLPEGISFQGLLPEAITTSVWRWGVHDADTTLMLKRLLHEGETFVDVGAHFGYFSVVSGALVGSSGRVISFEPMPEAFAYLKRNTAGLRATVVLHNLAAWEAPTTLEFLDAGVVNSSLNSAFALREQTLTQVDPVPVEVRARPLDEVLADAGRVDGIKIDAESAELQVLRGAINVLKECRPWLVIELGDLGADGEALTDPPASASIKDLLADLGYRPHGVAKDRVVPIDLVSPVRYLNVLFLPD